MLRKLLLTGISLCLPLQAHALSCMRWDAIDVYNRAAEAEERYVIVRGRFLRDGPDRLIEDTQEVEGMPVPYTYDALFFGEIGSRVGFRTPVELEVEINVTCAASWCGFPPDDGHDMLAFLQVDNNRNYSLISGPCPFSLIPEPTDEILDQIVACMRSQNCEPSF